VADELYYSEIGNRKEVKTMENHDDCENCEAFKNGTCTPNERGEPGGRAADMLREMIGGLMGRQLEPDQTRPIVETSGGHLIPGPASAEWSEDNYNSLRDRVAEDTGLTVLKAHEIKVSDWENWAGHDNHERIEGLNTFSRSPNSNDFDSLIISTHDFFL